MRQTGPLTLIDDHLERQRGVATGTGIVMHVTDTDCRTARQRLQVAADQAGISVEQAATYLIALYRGPRR